MAAILYADEEQKKKALESKKQLEEELQQEIKTEIMPLDVFYLAENYHQKYYLRMQPELSTELRAYYPDIEDLTDSTVAARLNGIAGGYGDPELLRREIDSYGLSEQLREQLEFVVY